MKTVEQRSPVQCSPRRQFMFLDLDPRVDVPVCTSLIGFNVHTLKSTVNRDGLPCNWPCCFCDFFIARQHAMHAERDIVLANNYVRLSNAALCLNVFDFLVGHHWRPSLREACPCSVFTLKTSFWPSYC